MNNNSKTIDDLIKDYSYSLQGDYGYSTDTKQQYYEQKLEEKENDVNYSDNASSQPEEPQKEESNWIDNIVNPYRLFMEKRDQTILSRRQNEVREGESLYNNGIKLAKEYLQYKSEFSDLKKALDSQKDWSESQVKSAINRLNQLDDMIQNLENDVVELDENGNSYTKYGIRTLARTNPYLQDIFYETRPGELFKSKDNFGKIKDLWNYYTVDWMGEKYFGDFNPGNNFKHLLENEGFKDIFGTRGKLSKQQIDYMWNIKNQNTDVYKQLEQLNAAEQISNARLADKNKDIQEIIHTLKHGNWLYNPTKISQEYREAQQNNDISLTDPKSWYYALPELGTSFSEIGAMFGQMGVSMLAKSAAKAATAAGTAGIAPLLIGVSELAAQAAITNYTRNSETQAEVFDSFKQRILNDVDKGNIDLNAVLPYLTNELQNRGFDTENLTDIEIFENALSQNIITPNNYLNKIIQDSQKGLDVVRQTNQALMFGDLAEGMFMFGGSYLKNAFGLNKAIKQSGLERTLSGNMKDVIEKRFTDNDLYRSADGILNRTIARTVDKLWKTPSAKTRAYDVIDNIVNIGKKMGVSYFTERTEEGQQHIVSKRYQAGEYDNSTYSMLDGAINAFGLGIEANAAYYGLHPDENLNSDKELKKAMEIGGFTGMFMSGVGTAPDIYTATQQAITDTKLKGYIADSYGEAERSNKIDQFINASKKNSKGSFNRIIHNLETLKNTFKPEGVTDQMIDSDIELVNTVQRYTSNNELNSIADELGVTYGDDTYNAIIKNAIAIQDRLNDASDASARSTKNIEEIHNKIRNDKQLDSEIGLWYQDYLSREKKKRSEARRKIVNDLNASTIENLTKEELSNFIDDKLNQQLGPENFLSEEAYKNKVISNMLLIQDYNDLLQLKNELEARKQNLESIKEDRQLDVNVKGISGIIKHVDTVLKQRKAVIDRLAGEDVGNQILDNGLSVSFKDQLTQANMIKYINDGARADLFTHAAAYITGRYVGDTRLYKPLYENLTDEQKKTIIQRGVEADQRNNRTIRKKDDIINEYNNLVEESWKEDEQLADQESVYRKRAISVIQYDLQHRFDIENNTREEIQEETGTTNEQASTQEEIEQKNEQPVEPSPTEENNGVQPPLDEQVEELEVPTPGNETNDDPVISDLEQKLNALDRQIEGVPSQEQISMDDSEEVTVEDELSENEKIELETQIQNPVTVEEVTSETDLSEEIKDNATDDATSSESTGMQEVVDNSTETQEYRQDDNIVADNQNLVENQDVETEAENVPEDEQTDEPKVEVKVEDKPDVSSIQPTPENPITTIDVVDTPNADRIFYDEQNQQAVYVPEGETPSAGIPIDDQDMLAQNQFDELYELNIMSKGPANMANEDVNSGVQTKTKHTRQHIANTFFYLPTAEDVMPINIADQPVQFVGKNGQQIERRPGGELAQMLSIPGWLNSADDIYYVVSRAKFMPSGVNAYDALAIHLMIEKDGKLYNASLRAIDQKLIDSMRRNGMTQDQIDEQINRLRDLRTRIINQYAPDYAASGGVLPVQARKHVKPIGLKISNGTLNNVVDNNGIPIYRSLTEVSDFGVSSDPIEMQQQILDGQLIFGYGTGPFGTNPFTIENIDGNSQTDVQGRGYAGKIYFIPNPKNTPSGTTTLPIMLAEELHRLDETKVKNANDIQLAYDTNGKRQYDKKGNPIEMSTAELIYELMTRRMMKGPDGKAIDNYLLSLLANNGSKTFTNGFDRLENAKYGFLVRKQLGIYTDDNSNRFFVNAFLSYDDNTGSRKYATNYTNLAQITETQKRNIVWNISRNIHWNTNKDVMMSPIPQEIVNYVVNAALSNPDKFTDENSSVVFWNNKLSFSLKDVGHTVKDGKPVKVSDAPLTITWMINHKILKTDLGQHAFSAPFVYSEGAVSVQEREQQQKPKAKETINTKGEVTGKITPKEQVEKSGKKTPVIAERATTENLQKYGLSIPNDGRKESVYLKWGIVTDPKTGQKKVVLAPTKFINGLASIVKGIGKLDVESAKKWLNDKLGISEDQIFVTDQMLQFGANKEAYGLMQVIMDTMTGELMPQISLSKQSGIGVEYHEAFHYVVQLMLTESQRNALYQNYVNNHPEAKDKTKEDIEELLAEEFRNYVLDQDRTGLLYKVVKFFKNLYNLITSWNSHKNEYKALFKSIYAGEFKNNVISKEILQEFYNRHPHGLSYYIPGMTKQEEQKLSHITDPDIFYKAVNALTTGALATFNIRTIDDVHRLRISTLFEALQTNIDLGWISEEYVDIANDIINNPGIFKRYNKNIEQLSINASDKLETEEQYKSKRELGENDNVWDRNQGEVSKKDNVGFRAKLFFYSIPKYEYQFSRDEETGVVSKELVPVYEDMFMLPVTENFNDVWNKIMENLWDIDNFQEIVDRCATLGETDPFFKSLYDILTSEENPIDDNTKTQLEVTIKSAKVQQNTIQVSHPKVDTRLKSDEEIADAINESLSKYNFEVLDSDNLRKINRLPAKWSSAFFASNAIERDSSGNPRISKEFGDYMLQKRNQLNILFRQINTRRTKKQAVPEEALKVEQIKDILIEMMNAMNIPMDVKALDYMLNTFYKGEDEFSKLKSFWEGKGCSKKLNKFNDGVVSNIIKLSKDKTIGIKSTSGSGYSRTIDRMFTYGSKNRDAQINIMAVAYGKTHPSPQEFSVVGADGALIYPISENNYMTDQIRNINNDANGKRQQILNTPFSKRSLIANAEGVKFKLHNFLCMNIDDTSRDYFGITPLEDYIAKLTLTFNDQLILPTMSDKKTWYSISGLTLVKDFLSSKQLNESEVNYSAVVGEDVDVNNLWYIGERRFSNNTLGIFVNYFLDEFEAVYDYFQKKDYVAKNPTKRVDNYHGKIKNGVMDSSGNGGRFRYFTKLRVGNSVININQDLDKLERYGTTQDVLDYLNKQKVLLFGVEKPNVSSEISTNSNIYNAINHLLVFSTEKEMRRLVKMGILDYKNQEFINKWIPNNIYAEYQKLAQSLASAYSSGETPLLKQDILYSIIGSHVANQAISIMEVEKCFTGDPAYYKWKKSEKREKRVKVTRSGHKTEDTVFSIITGKDVDKIKRLSSVLSTGTNLRTIWDDPNENDTSITVMHLKDNEIGSDYYDQLYSIFRNSILRDLYSDKNPTLDDSQIIEALSTKEKEEAFYNTLTPEQKKFVDDFSKASANPYAYEKNKNGDVVGGNINQSDAAVYVRPALYRRIMKALGQWSDEIEQAYQIIEGEDESWMNNDELYAKTLSLVVKPLKMVYFGDHREESMNLNIPVFDKMAMFPMFKVLAKADNRLLYDRMNNEELGVIDMLTFESAVKVGGRKKFQTYKDAQNNKFNTEELNKPSYNKTGVEGDLPVFVQDIRNLRLQLNTDPHEHIDRSFGTQAVKICLGNLIDDRIYGTNKGIQKTGEQLKNEVMDAINRLSDIGRANILKRFFNKDETVNNKALSDYLISQATSSGMSEEFIRGLSLDENGEFITPLAAMSSRQWIESRLSSYINKEVVDINTPGGSAIQMSSFGLKATGARTEESFGRAFNNGKKLRFLNTDGSMDVILSVNFFRHVLPKEYLDENHNIKVSFGTVKKYLIDKGIIGENSTPQGIGYRIPTQGLSSTFSFKVVDVLPDRFGDTVVVPDEFTAMTGSDFDVDKLYIAVLNYDKDGNIIQYDGDDISKQSVKALQNRIIQNYQLVVSDSKNMAETRASIDTLTKMLQRDVLPLIVEDVKTEADPFYELLPSFQESRKEEYTSGKAGIAPFALNSTNHVLTQLTHLNMVYSHNNAYKLGDLDAIKGQDGFRILDWLSAMINAHVDVAKDPYIITLNVNQITYNITNLLLRGGKGKNTFYFLAQPILREFSKRMIANKGVYGVVTQTENNIIANLNKFYGKLLRNAIDKMPDSPLKKQWMAKYNGIADVIGLSDTFQGISMEQFNPDIVFDQSRLINSLKNRKADNVDFLYQQLAVMYAYKQLSGDAKTLSELVQRSQIDTKKFGNNLALQLNFENSHQLFIYDNKDKFVIKGKAVDNPIQEYFSSTFLGKKWYNSYTLLRKLLKKQTFPATWVYQNIFNSVMQSYVGGSMIKGTNGNELISYKSQGNKDFVQKINKSLDSIIRARLTKDLPNFTVSNSELQNMFSGSNSMCHRLTKLKQYILQNKEFFPHLIGPDGTIKNELLNYLQEYPSDELKGETIDRIVLSESSMNNDYDRENQLITAFAQLLEDSDDIVREFAQDLVKYAYITSYDERGINAFFHLVPLQYKIDNGYVYNLKQALSQFKEGDSRYGYESIATIDDDPSTMSFPSIRVTMARNMWNDTELIHRYNLLQKPNSNDVFDQNDFQNTKITYDQILFKSTIKVNGKPLLIADAVAMPIYKTNQEEFITIINSSGSKQSVELYQLIGFIAYQNDEGVMIRKGARAIYKRIPKLGVMENGFQINEYFKSGSEESAFTANEFSQNVIIDDNIIIEKAYEKVKLNKLSDKTSYTKNFFPHVGVNINVKVKGTEKAIISDPNEAFNTTAAFDSQPLDIPNISLEDVDSQVNDFVNISLNDEFDETPLSSEQQTDFDAGDAMQLVSDRINNMEQLQSELEMISNTSIETDPFASADMFNNEDFTNMADELEINGRKRKNECK